MPPRCPQAPPAAPFSAAASVFQPSQKPPIWAVFLPPHLPQAPSPSPPVILRRGSPSLSVILRRVSPSLSVILRRGSPSLSVILRSAATKNLSYHVFEPGEKILRFAQNDKRGNAVILRRVSPSLSVILRSAATKNLSYHVFEPGEKILRFAQNDKRGNAVIPWSASLPRPTRYILYWPVKFPVAKAIVHSV